MILDYKKAKEELLTELDYDCQQFFVKKGYILENAYYELLSDNLEKAKNLFSAIKNNDIRAHWACFMISMIEANVREYPSYFELRNFLEIDLNILIHYFKGDYVEKIVRYADFMFTINPEVHKFIGRVFYNNGYLEQGMFFLDRAKSYFYHDPELHYLLAYIYYNNNQVEQAKKALEDCIKILPDYFPAESLLKKIKSEIK